MPLRVWRPVALLAACLPLQGIGAGAPVDAPFYEPAHLRTDNASLARQIAFPDVAGDVTRSVPCRAEVSRKGKLSKAFCFAGGRQDRPFERAVIRAADRAKMHPARIDGKAVAVTMHFTAIFDRRDGHAQVHVVPHHFLNATELGVAYYAPQLLRRSVKSVPRSCINNDLMVRVVVDAAGRAAGPVFHRGDPADGCIERGKQWVVKKRFIPGMVSGEPAAMPHVVVVRWTPSWATRGRP